ncbi:MAG: signal recognition particle protein [Gammaproteobacteria bacterium]|nr:signal recognition particle protein [Gammaproteobacteria bacterium]
MFEQLGDRLQVTFKKLRGQGRLSEENISDAMREVRIALLEADVSLPVVKSFVGRVKEKAIGADVAKGINPGQMVIKIVRDEMVELMGQANDALNLAQTPPAVILVAGLQGAGKTTTVAKLANLLKQRNSKRVMVASADVYRPAAIEQLKTLAESIDVQWCESDTGQEPVAIVKNAISAARNSVVDVLIVDTAGRQHIDAEMMKEIQAVHEAARPIETLFVVDSMTGQDAVYSAKAFNEALPLTGVILTKTDGDARGGAALSIREVTGKPIKFLGIGEKIDGIEAFHPDRVASRILGMGDVMTLIEEAEHKVDKQKAQKLVKKLKKGRGFDLEDYRDQVAQMNNMGGIENMMGKLPGMGNLNIPSGAVGGLMGDMNKSVAIINSMTPKERAHPLLIQGGRKKRIAAGSGTQIQDVNKTLKQFNQMQKMMKKMGGKGKMAKMMRGMGGMPGMGGKIPPGRGGMPF